MTFSVWSGWVALTSFLAAGSIPLASRFLAGRRATTDSRPIRAHVLVGLTTTAAALGHALSILPAMGSPAAVAGGTLALAPGALAFFLLFAHVGVGLKLRKPRLRERAATRRTHVVIATFIALAVSAHVFVLYRAR